LEQQLIRIWEEVLGVKPIGIDDRFLDLGGHSLLAARMMAQVEKKFGRKIPVSILFRASTVEKLARAIREEGLAEAGTALVEIQPHGSRPPIFWLHTLGGDGGSGLFTYAQLAQQLGPDQPSYGLVAPPGPQPATLEEMAAYYAREIRSVQPKGPYQVGGYCFGGVLAYEVARQLAPAGDPQGRVILLEAAPGNPPPGQPGLFSLSFVSHLCRTLPAWSAAALGDPRDLWRRGQHIGQRIWKLARSRLGRRRESQVNPAQQLGTFIDVTNYPAEFRAHAEAHWRAFIGYRPRPFSGRLLVLHTPRPRLLMYSPGFLWRLLAPHVEARVLSGTHDNLLQAPQVGHVAQAVREVLERDLAAA
jgi:thioesterase domain-containing protein/acyl carrier protein